MPAAVGGDVDRRGREPGLLERLEDRLGAPQQCRSLRLTTVSRRPCDEARARSAANEEPYSTRRSSCRFHQTRCGIPWTSGCAAGRDRGEAYGRQRRKRRDGAAVAAVVEQEAERRRVGRLEHRRRQAVDHDQDDRLRARCSVTGERAQARVPLGRAAPRPQADAGQERRPRGSRGSGRTRAQRRASAPTAHEHGQAEARPAAAERAGHERGMPNAPATPPDRAGHRLVPLEDAEADRGPERPPPRTAANGQRRTIADAAMPSATPSPASTPIQYQPPTGRVYPRRSPGREPIGDHPAVRALDALRGRPATRSRRSSGRGLLIWGATLLAYLVFEAQYAQPLHTGGGAEDVVQHDVGWAIDVWGRWDSGWFLGIAQHGYADPANRPRSSRSTRCSCAASAGSSSATTCSRGSSSRWPPRPSRSCSSGSSRSRSPGSRRRTGRCSTWRSSRPRSSSSPSTASRSTSCFSVAAFLLAVRGRWAWAGSRPASRR